MRYGHSAIRLCWHCDNQVHGHNSPAHDELADRNAAEWVINQARIWLALPEGHQVTTHELSWWAVVKQISDLLPEHAIRISLRMPAPEEKPGLSKSELAIYLADIINDKHKNNLAFCTDGEGILIDQVVGSVLSRHSGLIALLHERYDGKGKNKIVMAANLQRHHQEMSIMTCRRRIDTWLSLAESMLHEPMCDAFDTNSERFYLKCEQKTA